jgi:hypothetical protein
MVISGVHEAFSLAIASGLWIGVAAAVVALLITVVGLPELPLRRHHGPARAGRNEGESGEPSPSVVLD